MAMTKPAGGWTYDDLFRLPEDKRYEIIDGKLYEMPSPNSEHATVVINIIAALLPLMTTLGARIFTAPLDVFLGADVVHPDVIVLLPDRINLISRRGIEGPPDLAVEVLSPNNPERDRIIKRSVYARGGVREYWLVSPEAATVEVLALEGNAYRTHVRAGGEEPVTSTVLPDLSFPASAVFSRETLPRDSGGSTPHP